MTEKEEGWVVETGLEFKHHNTAATVKRVLAAAYRQRLLCLFVLLLGDIQPVDEALQLLPEGFHLGIDAVQQLVLSDPGEKGMFEFLDYDNSPVRSNGIL